jgi:hypothetical protein
VQLGKHFLSDVVRRRCRHDVGTNGTIGHGKKQVVVTPARVGGLATFTLIER